MYRVEKVPHVFSVASVVYDLLMEKKEDQSVIVSGEVRILNHMLRVLNDVTRYTVTLQRTHLTRRTRIFSPAQVRPKPVKK